MIRQLSRCEIHGSYSIVCMPCRIAADNIKSRRIDELEAEIKRLKELVMAVNVYDSDIICADLGDKNWFDARDDALRDYLKEKP